MAAKPPRKISANVEFYLAFRKSRKRMIYMKITLCLCESISLIDFCLVRYYFINYDFKSVILLENTL